MTANLDTTASRNGAAMPTADPAELAKARRERIDRTARWLLPVVVMVATIALWQWYVVAYKVPHYILPGPAELPRFRLGHSETPSPYTRHGIKGVGEGAAIAPGGAILNAINDALGPDGVELNRLPATPARILAALIERKGTTA